MTTRLKMTRQKDAFNHFDQLLGTFTLLTKKREHSEKHKRQTAVGVLRFRNVINLAESDIYSFSLERSQLKSQIRQLHIKYNQIHNTYSERKEKFTIAAESINYFKYRIEILIEQLEELE